MITKMCVTTLISWRSWQIYLFAEIPPRHPLLLSLYSPGKRILEQHAVSLGNQRGYALQGGGETKKSMSHTAVHNKDNIRSVIVLTDTPSRALLSDTLRRNNEARIYSFEEPLPPPFQTIVSILPLKFSFLYILVPSIGLILHHLQER